MEAALLLVFIFTACIIVMTVALPLLLISRIIRMLKNSFAKLFVKTPKKA